VKDYFGKYRSGLILAADLPSESANSRVLEVTADLIDVIKICSPLIYAEGLEVVSRLRRRFGKPIFTDLKLADVAHTCVTMLSQARDAGASAVMVHGMVGPETLEQCIAAGGDDLGVVVQLELTGPGGALFTAGVADDVARLAATMEVYGAQAPGNRPQRVAAIRSIMGRDRVLVCCGVGRQGGSYSAVMEAGGANTYAIVGRSIYESSDPRAAATKFLQERNLSHALSANALP